MRLQRLEPAVATRPECVDAGVLLNEHIADRYWRVVLQAPHVAATVEPGQFVLLSIPHPLTTLPVLPRPMAVYDCDPGSGTIDVLYGVVGPGTQRLSAVRPGGHMTVVGPLGVSFQIPADASSLLVVGRGIGTCSLTLLARREAARGSDVFAVASGRHEGALIGPDFYSALGVPAIGALDSNATSTVSDVRAALLARLDDAPPQVIATCGSDRLARLTVELGERWGADTQMSVEAHMACGLGYCHGCAAGERGVGTESPLVCTEGPVFRLR